MIIEHSSALKNVFRKISNSNRDNINTEISRLGSVEQRSTEYRRNGMLNFGSKQMLAIAGDHDFLIVGMSGGSSSVG